MSTVSQNTKDSVIVVGYIPTPEGVAAVEYAGQLAAKEAATLVVVNTGVRGSDADPSYATSADWDALEEQLTAQGVRHEMHQLSLGTSPAEEILAVAEQRSGTLIVVGLRRRSPVGKLVLGSTSQEVLLRADCPVLAVKRP
jgi:nucleotide-binding universal stress UspA family protein